jgi:exopolysaccharide production protein ExoZ
MSGPKTEQQRPRTLYGIQALRGVAALMVVLHHATFSWGERAPGYIWRNGAGGVDIFFIISGLVMAITSAGKESGWGAAGRFIERRVVRIMPLYWIMSLLALGKLYFVSQHQSLGNHAQHLVLTTSYVWRSFFLVPVQGQLPVLGQGWTLSYEMFFYILFALCLVTGRRIETTLTVVLVPLGIAGFFQSDAWPAVLTLVSPLLLEFLAGLWLGSALRRGVRFDHWWWIVAGCVSVPILFAIPSEGTQSSRLFYWGIPAFFIVAAAVAAEARFSKWWPQWLLLVGDSSYSLYLTHALVLVVLERVLIRDGRGLMNLPHGIAETLFLAVCAVVCALVGICTYYGLEKPLIVAFRHVMPDRRHKISREAYETAQ